MYKLENVGVLMKLSLNDLIYKENVGWKIKLSVVSIRRQLTGKLVYHGITDEQCNDFLTNNNSMDCEYCGDLIISEETLNKMGYYHKENHI